MNIYGHFIIKCQSNSLQGAHLNDTKYYYKSAVKPNHLVAFHRQIRLADCNVHLECSFLALKKSDLMSNAQCGALEALPPLFCLTGEKSCTTHLYSKSGGATALILKGHPSEKQERNQTFLS